MTSLIPQRTPAVRDLVGRGCSIREAVYKVAVDCTREMALSYGMGRADSAVLGWEVAIGW